MTVFGDLQFGLSYCVEATDAILRALASVANSEDLARLMEAVARDLGFRHYALIHHDDLRGSPSHRVRLLNYPASIRARIIDQCTWRRDPVIRGCLFSPHAFLWSGLPDIIAIDRKDKESFALGLQAGLNEGITIPWVALGECMGSCTFAGMHVPENASRVLGMAQMVGIFAFQAAKRVLTGHAIVPAPPPRLHPRPRDCVILAGQGKSNKEIARALGLTPRTVDGYLREARHLFNAHDRTELVFAAVFAGEIGLHELQRDQPA